MQNITSEKSLLIEEDKDNDLSISTDKKRNLFSFFKAPINNTQPEKSISIEEIADLIQSDFYKERTENLRKLSEKEQKEFKQSKLDVVTFSALCTHRSKEGVISRSNYFCIDIDHVGGKAEIEALKQQILDNFNPVLIFVSPRGEGLKVVCHINTSVAEHFEYFQAFENYFNEIVLKGLKDTKSNVLIIDKICKDIARSTFLCYDNNIIFCENPTKFGKSFIDYFRNSSKQKEVEFSGGKSILETALTMVRNSNDGVKHFTLLKSSVYVGGGIAGGCIDESEAIKKLEAEIKLKSIDNFENAQKTIRNGIEYGKKTPITETKHKEKKQEYNYFNFPICLITGIFNGRLKVLENIIDYTVYAKAIEKEEGNINDRIEAALKFLKITERSMEHIKQNGELQFNSISKNSPKVGIKLEMLRDYYKNYKTEFEIIVFSGFCAIKSILLKKTYCKITNEFMLIRMAGFSSTKEIDNLPEALKKYNNRYQLDKIKKELRQNWNLKVYARCTRGFYVSFGLELETLILEAEKKRKKYIDKNFREEEAEVRKRVLRKLYEPTAP